MTGTNTTVQVPVAVDGAAAFRTKVKADLLEMAIRSYEARLADHEGGPGAVALWFFDWAAFEVYVSWVVENLPELPPDLGGLNFATSVSPRGTDVVALMRDNGSVYGYYDIERGEFVNESEVVHDL
jgi:hypothetical protein